MPKPLAVDWNEVRTLALAIGVREAARRMNITEGAVMQRSKREGWFRERHEASAALASIGDTRKQLIATATGTSVSAVSNTPTAAEILSAMGKNTKAALATGLQRAAEHVADLPGEDILDRAQDVGSLVKSASLVHGWADHDARRDGPMLVNVDLRGLVLPSAEPVEHATGPIIDVADAGAAS
jgi:hypothetical protein